MEFNDRRMFHEFRNLHESTSSSFFIDSTKNSRIQKGLLKGKFVREQNQFFIKLFDFIRNRGTVSKFIATILIALKIV